MVDYQKLLPRLESPTVVLLSLPFQKPITLGEHTGFKVYFTEDGKNETYEFTEESFSYTEKIGRTVDGASKYKVYVSKDIRSYMNFKNYNDLAGFSNMVVTNTSFSTKL